MPLMNKNYVTPAWIDNAAPPINDDELNAMSETLEGSQILVGNGAPTSSTPGKVGQRYADINTTPATMYEVENQAFPGQPIPVVESAQQAATEGYLLFLKNTGSGIIEHRIASLSDAEITALLVMQSSINTIAERCFCPRPYFKVVECEYNRTSGVIQAVYNFENNGLRDYNTGLYYTYYGAATAEDTEIIAPIYASASEANAAAANPPPVWKTVRDPNASMARPYSTGSSYAAGDYCIHEGKLWKALDATSGVWDGSKWERAWYADDLGEHVADEENPHNVTAAQTGAISPTVLATVQATTTAVRDYYAGEYFFYEGQLYELKEAVQQGGDLLEDEKSMPAVLGDGIAELGAKTGSITLGAVWTGEDPYSQTVTVTGATITGRSKIDLVPTAAQLGQLAEDGVISLLIENNGGTLTAWAVGGTPATAMTIACTVTDTV